MTENNNVSMDSVNNLFALEKVKQLPLVESVKRTVNEIYLPEGYKAQYWEDPEEREIHIKITNDLHDESRFRASLYALGDIDHGFINKEGNFYREFPVLNLMIKESITRINRYKRNNQFHY